MEKTWGNAARFFDIGLAGPFALKTSKWPGKWIQSETILRIEESVLNTR